MFDAKSLLEMMIRGSQQSAPQSAPQPSQGNDGGFDLNELIRQFNQPGGQAGTGSSPLQNIFPDAGQTGGQAQSGGQGTGGLGDILGQLQKQGGGGAGGIADVLGQVFGQATQGAKEGAGKITDAAGLRELIEKVSGGRSADEIMSQLQDVMSQNKLGTGAALGGLGALILGTRTGRSIAVSAAKLGALALIGGLAYKAYQNYSDGKPLITGREEPQAAPSGTGFDEQSVSNNTAQTYIRAMIAAAASDGRLDATEQQRIVGSLSDQGLDAAAEEFLANELNNPASIDELVASISSQQEAIQLYTAARIAIEPDAASEREFLFELASRLGIDDDLRAHLDAGARAAA